MAILTHPLLLRMSQHIDKKHCPLRWIDVYAAQYMVDALSTMSATTKARTTSTELSQASIGQTLDLFAEQEEATSIVPLGVEDMLVLGVMCSYVTSLGQTCLSVAQLPQELLQIAIACGYRPAYQSAEQLSQALRSLDQPSWLRCESEFASASEQDSHHAALILSQDKLYLAKYWRLHQRFEAWLASRIHYLRPVPDDIVPALSQALKVLFQLDQDPDAEHAEVDWQALAAAHTLINPFSLITGGPGTGKTTTAASLLSLLIYKQQLMLGRGSAPGSDPINLHIHLLAPTGKAAVRLADAIRFQLLQIESRLAENGIAVVSLSDRLPAAGETVHRFLYQRGGLRDAIVTPKAFNSDEVLVQYGQHQVNSVEHDQYPGMDIIIVDESSMMDLALMVELISLIPEHSQLILLGDHYQLPAVDPGQVFADCVARFSLQSSSSGELAVLSELSGFPVENITRTRLAEPPELGFQPLCVLRKTYRFGGDLKRAAEFIQQGEYALFMQQFRALESMGEVSSQVIWHSLNLQQQAVYPAIVSAYQAYFDAVASKAELARLVECFEEFQLLCSTLEGPLGVDYLNHYIEQYFREAWHANAYTFAVKDGGALYHGKAILVSRNHPHLGIFNGDIGFIIEDPTDGGLNVHFPGADQSVNIVPPARIREWQSAYAMTVHKSQGSEYRRVGVVLADYAKELLTRSLLYTALTRSKQHCEIWAADEALKKAFEQKD